MKESTTQKETTKQDRAEEGTLGEKTGLTNGVTKADPAKSDVETCEENMTNGQNGEEKTIEEQKNLTGMISDDVGRSTDISQQQHDGEQPEDEPNDVTMQ